MGDIDGFAQRRDRMRSPSDFIARYATVPLAFEPGRAWRYSNFGFVVLGRIIEVASGQSYDDYVREHIFKPAGMTETDAFPHDVKIANRAVPYTNHTANGEPTDDERRDATSLLPMKGEPFGCQDATAEDLMRFGVALTNGKLLDVEDTRLVTSAKVRTAVISPNIAGGEFVSDGYGIGQGYVKGVRFVGHNGGTFGVSAEADFLPESGYQVVVLSNFDQPASARIGTRALLLLARLLGAP